MNAATLARFRSDKRRLAAARRRVNRARDFSANTCPASRHLHMIDKLPLHEVKDAAELAAARIPYNSDRRRFLYFCKVCWNKITEADHA